MDTRQRNAAAILFLLADQMQAGIYRERMQEYGYDRVDVMSSADEAFRAAEQSGYSVVICDVALKGGTDGIEAGTRLSKKHGIPLIFLSRKQDEETFQKARQANPWAFLTKPLNWIELRMAVEHIISQDVPESKEKEKELRLSEDLFRSSFEHAGIGMVLFEPDGRFSRVNRRTEEILGYSADELAGMSYPDITHKDDVALSRQHFRTLVQGERDHYQFEKRYLHKNGSLRWIRLNNAGVYDSQGLMKYAIAQLQDVTQERETEGALYRTNQLLNQAQEVAEMGSWEVDLETKVVYWSETTRNIHEVGEDFQPHLDEAFDYYPGDSGKKLREAFEKAVSEGEPYDLELEFISARGTRLWVHTIGYPEMVDGRCVRAWGVFRDITYNKQTRLELIRMNESLAEHKLILDQVLEHTEDQTYIIDRRKKYQYVSRSAAEFLGSTQNEVIGKNPQEIGIPPEFTTPLFKQLETVFRTGQSLRNEMKISTETGLRYLEYIISPMKDLDEQVTRALIIARDQTERKQMIERIEQTGRELSLLNRLNATANEGMTVPRIARRLGKDLESGFGIDGATLYLYDEANKQLVPQNRIIKGRQKKKIEALIGKNLPSYSVYLEKGGWYKGILDEQESRYTEDPETIISIAKAFTGNKGFEKLLPSIIKLMNIKSVLSVPLLKDDQVIGLLDVSSRESIGQEVINSLNNISAGISNLLARRTADEALRLQEENYRILHELAPNGVLTLDMKGRVSTINKAFTKITGFDESEVIGTTIQKIPTIPENKIKEYLNILTQVLRGRLRSPVEFEWNHKDGSRRWGEAHFSRLKKSGKTAGLQIVLIDITGRKEAENALRQSEEKFRTLFKNMAQGVFYQAADGQLLDVNRAALEMLGVSRSQFLGRTSMHPEWKVINKEGKELPPDQHVSAKALQTGKTYRNQVIGVYNPKKKHYVWLTVNAQPQFKKGEGKASQVFVTLHDITESRNFEQELQRKNEYIQTILDNLPIGVAVNHIGSTKVTYMNKRFEEIYGWPEKDMQDIESFFRLVYPDEAYRRYLVDMVMKDIESGDPERMSWEKIRATGKDGTKKIINAKNIPLTEQNLMVSTVQDVTEQVQAEERIKEALETFKNLVEYNPSGLFIYEYAPDGTLLLKDANPAAGQLTGIEKDQWIGEEFDRIWPRAKDTGVTEKFLDVARTGKPWITEDLFYEDDRLSGAFRINSFRIPGNQLVVAFENITELKRSEKLVVRERDRANQYLNIAASLILAIDKDGRITLLNDDGARILEVEKEKAIGLNWFDNFLPDENRNEVKRIFKRLVSGDSEEESVKHVENKVITFKGNTRTIRWHNSLLRDAAGNITGTLSSGEDTTEIKKAEQELRESEARYKDLVEKSGVAIAIDDREGNITYFNRDFARLFGFSVAGMRKKERKDLIHPEDIHLVEKYHNRRMEGKRIPNKYVVRGIRKDKSLVWIELKTTRLQQDRQITGTRNYLWDITERMHAEEVLQYSETRFRELFSRMKSGVVIHQYSRQHRDFVIVNMNVAGEKITRKKRGEVIGRTVMEAFPLTRDMGTWDALKQVYETGQPAEIPVTHLKADDFEAYLEHNIYKLPSGEVVAVFEDISERLAYEYQIKKSYQEITKLSRHVEMIREEERKQIARNLHDDLGQILTAVKMDLSWIRKKLPGEEKSLLKRTDSAIDIVNQAISGVQGISAELRPPVLDRLGLLEAIRMHVADFQKRTRIKTHLQLPDHELPIHPDIMISVFRILQEALTNIARHSSAGRVHLIIREKNDTLDIRIQDNGVGISEEKIHSSSSLGLISMRERVLRWGGAFRVLGSEGEGTIITARIPTETDKQKE